MTDYSLGPTPLGIGAILGETTSLLFSNFFTACGIALIPIGIGMILSAGLFGLDVASGQATDPDIPDLSFYMATGVDLLIQVVAYSIATAMLVSFAYDVKLGRSKPLSAYFTSVISNLVPLVVVSTLSFIVIMVGTMALVLPGLWAYAVFSVIAPVIMMESAGFGALSRSAELTKEYRWPIVGLLIVMFIVSFIAAAIAGFLVGFTAAISSNPFLLLGLNIVATTVGFAFGCIMVAMLYARLREIKEGVSVDHLADVFS